MSFFETILYGILHPGTYLCLILSPVEIYVSYRVFLTKYRVSPDSILGGCLHRSDSFDRPFPSQWILSHSHRSMTITHRDGHGNLSHKAQGEIQNLPRLNTEFH